MVHYEFGDFVLEARARVLRRGAHVVPLPPKALDLLLALLDARGAVVSKAQLLERVWPGLFVEEANLPQNISLIRRALGESPQDHWYIVTLPGVGYQFAAPVVVREDTGAASTPASVVVLPFTNDLRDPSADYLCDGLTEGIITTLSRLGGLRVIARAVAHRLKQSDLDPLAAGRALGVALVVVGRVTPGALVVELIETASGWQVWTGEFSAHVKDSLAVQEQVTRRVAEALQVRLTPDDDARVAVRVTSSSPAYQHYMKGRYLLNKRLTETLPVALQCFRDAIDLDPGFALAWVGMADTWALQSLYGASRPVEVFPLSRAAAERALQVDADLAEAHNSLGVCALFYEWDWVAAERAFTRAITLNPDYADAHQRYGLHLTTRGRFDEARAALARAQALDPLSLITGTIAAYPDYYSGRYEAAEQQLARVLALDPQFSMAHFRRGLALAQLGRFDDAEAELQVSQRLSGDRDVTAALGRVYAMQGRVSEARAAIDALLERSKAAFVPAYALAVIEAALGDADAAFTWLARAVEERSYWVIYLDVDPALDALRGDERYERVCRMVSPP